MRLSYRIKTTVLVLELIIAVPYTVLVFLGRMADIAAVLEWIIAFLLIPYLLSMGIDVFHIKDYIYHWHNTLNQMNETLRVLDIWLGMSKVVMFDGHIRQYPESGV